VESETRRTYPVEDSFSRTSVTVHEAVAIMLGYADGPIVMRSFNENPSDEELEALRSAPFYIDEGWREERESLEDACRRTGTEGSSQESIDKAAEALETFEREVSEAKRWLCEIEDELSKGEASALRLDTKHSHDHFPHITLWSLREWAQDKGYETRLVPVSRVGDATPKLRMQETVILETLESLGHDPKRMPPNSKGVSGVKSAVSKKIDGKEPFLGSTVFKKAWDRMLSTGDIAYEK